MSVSRTLALLLLSTLSALPARAQWERIDAGYGLSGSYNTNLVAFDGTYLYATVVVTPPVRLEVYRSADEGTTWTLVHTLAGASSATFLRDLEGRLAMGISNVLLFSDDRGATWTRQERPGQVTTVARDGDTYVAGESAATVKSVDGGVTWTATTGTVGALGHVVSAGGAFLGVNGFGFVYRLPAGADTWTQVTWAAPNIATGVWEDGGTFYLKTAVGALYASDDAGATWTQQPTDVPTVYNTALPAPAGDAWLLYTAAFATDLFVTRDDGATTTAIGADYPRNDLGSLCTSNFAATTHYFVGNAWSCSFTDPSRNGVFRYRFAAPSTTAAEDEAGIPQSTALHAAYPNPFNPSTTLAYTLPGAAHVRLSVHDLLGREVALLVDAPVPAGTHTAAFNAVGLASGVYLYRLEAGAETRTRRVVLMK